MDTFKNCLEESWGLGGTTPSCNLPQQITGGEKPGETTSIPSEEEVIGGTTSGAGEDGTTSTCNLSQLRTGGEKLGGTSLVNDLQLTPSREDVIGGTTPPPRVWGNQWE